MGDLNNIQKVCIMVGVGSLVVFLTIFIFEEYGIFYNTESFFVGFFGIIAIFNMVVSTLGFFLFKDK